MHQHPLRRLHLIRSPGQSLRRWALRNAQFCNNALSGSQVDGAKSSATSLACKVGERLDTDRGEGSDLLQTVFPSISIFSYCCIWSLHCRYSCVYLTGHVAHFNSSLRWLLEGRGRHGPHRRSPACTCSRPQCRLQDEVQLQGARPGVTWRRPIAWRGRRHAHRLRPRRRCTCTAK